MSMSRQDARHARRFRRSWILGASCLALLSLPPVTGTRARAQVPNPVPTPAQATPATFPFRNGDRVAWIGSSSTKIGVWPRTMEFLLRTRHPELTLEAKRFTTGGGTFATGLKHLDQWLAEFKPTLVFFNYGGNDAGAGDQGLPSFLANMEKCVAKVEAAGARVVLVTPQAADVRKSGEEPAAKRQKYAEVMLEHGRAKGWSVVDTHHPLGVMQESAQKEDPTYSMLKDKIHLTDSAYVGWGYLLYDLLGSPTVESAATVTSDGRVAATTNCEILDTSTKDGVLSFTRADKVLPILPPIPLPPRRFVPLEARSRYLLKVTGLPAGTYELSCEGQTLGRVDAQDLSAGINLNTMLLDSGQKAPWQDFATQLWENPGQAKVGDTRWRFEIRKK